MKVHGRVSSYPTTYMSRIQTPGQLGDQYAPITTLDLKGRPFIPYSSRTTTMCKGGSRRMKKNMSKRRLKHKKRKHTKSQTRRRPRRQYNKKRRSTQKGGVYYSFKHVPNDYVLRGRSVGYTPIHAVNHCGQNSSLNMNASTQHAGLKGGNPSYGHRVSVGYDVSDPKMNYILRGTRGHTMSKTHNIKHGGRYKQYLSNISYSQNYDMPGHKLNPSEIGLSSPAPHKINVYSYDNYVHKN